MVLEMIEVSEDDRIADYNRLKLKYQRAASYLWLPDEPDPPEPK
jgi:hypothetical protein